MNTSRIAPAILILALLAACENQPTAVNEADNLQPQLFQEGKGNFELWFAGAEGGYYGEVPCFNDGAGEEANYYWSYSVWGKDHMTPSGNYLGNVKVIFDETTYMEGLTTGDIWRPERMHESVPQKVHFSDGLLFMWGNLWIRYVKDDGDKVVLHEIFRIGYDGPDLVSFDVKVKCAPH